MRLFLAIKCFFLILFLRRLPPEAAALLPAQPAPPPPALPPKAEPEPVPPALAATQPITPSEDGAIRGAVQMLMLLQREGRLLDFLQEEIDAYSDAQIGAAVRDIHRGCRKALAEHAPLEPILRDQENAAVRVDPGFDPSRIRLVGNVVGDPPFKGTLRHHGWRTQKITLPALSASSDPTVIAPAEVEL